SGIKGAQVIELVADFHPIQALLVFTDVANLRVGFAADEFGVDAKDGGVATTGGNEVHKDLDGGSFTGTIWTHKSINRAFGNFQVHAVESKKAAVVLGQVEHLNCRCHREISGPFIVQPR